jgi:hypothetical protein
VNLLGGEQESPAPFERQFWFRERVSKPPVQSSRESRNRLSRVRERADIRGAEFEREPKQPFQGSRE